MRNAVVPDARAAVWATVHAAGRSGELAELMRRRREFPDQLAASIAVAPLYSERNIDRRGGVSGLHMHALEREAERISDAALEREAARGAA